MWVLGKISPEKSHPNAKPNPIPNLTLTLPPLRRAFFRENFFLTPFLCCTLFICNKISIRKPIVDISYIQLFWFPCIVSCKQNINLTEVFHVKPSRLAFPFLPPVSFEIFTAGFLVGFSSFLPFTDRRNPTILIYEIGSCLQHGFFIICSQCVRGLLLGTALKEIRNSFKNWP